MKSITTLIGFAFLAAMTFTVNKASAVPTVLSITGTAIYNSNSIVKTHTIVQKDLLVIFEQATGDTSITNKPTVIYYDPDAFNTNAWNSNEGFSFYGTFYYSNSVSHFTSLDGIDGSGDYYSCIEFDYNNSLLGWTNGFWNPYAVENNNVLATTVSSGTAHGNGILYIHDNVYAYNIPDGNLFFANDSNGDINNYAVVIHGSVLLSGSISSGIETESLTVSGSGDGLWDDKDLVISAKATFKGKGLNDLF